MEISGFQSDISNCARCEKIFSDTETAFFDERNNDIVCFSCRGQGDMLDFTPGGLKYLKYSSKLDIDQSMSIGLDSKSVDVLKRILIAIVQGIVEYPLNTLKKNLIYHR